MATVADAPRTKVTPPPIRRTQCFIDGKWGDAASGKTFETLNPATEEVIAEVFQAATAGGAA